MTSDAAVDLVNTIKEIDRLAIGAIDCVAPLLQEKDRNELFDCVVTALHRRDADLRDARKEIDLLRQAIAVVRLETLSELIAWHDEQVKWVRYLYKDNEVIRGASISAHFVSADHCRALAARASEAKT